MYKILITDETANHTLYTAEHAELKEGFLVMLDARLEDGNPAHVRTFMTAIKTDRIGCINVLKVENAENV